MINGFFLTVWRDIWFVFDEYHWRRNCSKGDHGWKPGARCSAEKMLNSGYWGPEVCGNWRSAGECLIGGDDWLTNFNTRPGQRASAIAQQIHIVKGGDACMQIKFKWGQIWSSRTTEKSWLEGRGVGIGDEDQAFMGSKGLDRGRPRPEYHSRGLCNHVGIPGIIYTL